MLFSELIDNICLDVDENVNDEAMVTKLKNFINRGYKELAKRENLCKTKEINITNGKGKLPYDCYKVFHCYYNNDPIKFSILGNSLMVDDYDKVTVLYCYFPDNLEVLSDETETKDCNAEFILMFAKYLYYMSESLTEEASIFKAEFERFEVVKQNIKIEKIVDVYGVI